MNSWTAIWTTEHVHGIPHHDFELAERDYSKLWKSIINFALPENSHSTDEPLTILYAKVMFTILRGEH
jgi:hypothetical protein